MTDIQTAAKDIQAVTPYLFEIVAFCFIVGSLFVTNLIKKVRWFPAFLCRIKTSASGKYTYRKLEKKYLVLIALSLSYGGVSWALLQRYENAEQVYVITGLIVALQWLLVESAFKFAKGTKLQPLADTLKGKLYVPDDATMMMKTVARVSGGGVDSRNDKTRPLTKEEKAAITGGK